MGPIYDWLNKSYSFYKLWYVAVVGIISRHTINYIALMCIVEANLIGVTWRCTV